MCGHLALVSSSPILKNWSQAKFTTCHSSVDAVNYMTSYWKILMWALGELQLMVFTGEKDKRLNGSERKDGIWCVRFPSGFSDKPLFYVCIQTGTTSQLQPHCRRDLTSCNCFPPASMCTACARLPVLMKTATPVWICSLSTHGQIKADDDEIRAARC